MVPKSSLDKALEFLRLSIGDPGATLSTECRTVLDHFLLLMNDSKFPFTQALHPDYEADLDDLSRTLSAFCAILRISREERVIYKQSTCGARSEKCIRDPCWRHHRRPLGKRREAMYIRYYWPDLSPLPPHRITTRRLIPDQLSGS